MYQHSDLRQNDSIKRSFSAAAILFCGLLLLCILWMAPHTAEAASISNKKLTLYTGETYKLKVKNMGGSVKWSSSKKSVATVNKGKVTARKKGKTVIRAKAGGRTVSCTVTVKNTALDKETLSLMQYEIGTLTLDCGQKGKIAWSSSAPAVAVVCGEHGNSVFVNSRKAGSTVITATYLGKSYSCQLTVNVLPASVTGEDLMKKDPLYGKTIAVYGSSNEVGKNNSSGRSWVDFLRDDLDGIATVVNKSVGGNTVAKSVERMEADPNLSSYDIILVTTVRNSYRGGLALPSAENPRGFLHYLYKLYSLINPQRQSVFVASCLPYEDDFNTLFDTMAVYDGLVYKACRRLGFRYLDMHSWLSVTGKDATEFTADGLHYLAAAHPYLGKAARVALEKGGESLRTYQTKVMGDELLKVVNINPEFAEVCEKNKNVSYYSIDTDFNVSLYLWLTAVTDIPAGSEILKSAPGVAFYPPDSCVYGRSAWGSFRMAADGSVTMNRAVEEGTDFVVQISSRALLDAGL